MSKKQLGKFIVIYGSNNLGKSTQVKLLSCKILESKKDVLTIKYPIYSLKPTGQKINNIIRKEVGTGKALTSELELQKIYAQNRMDFQPQLLGILEAGINVVAEDYAGTGIAWGMTKGMTIRKLEEINRGLVSPDLAILLDGSRFEQAKEIKHRYENADAWEQLRQLNLFSPNGSWERNREIHQILARRYGWKMVDANQNVDKVAQDIWDLVSVLEW